MAEPLAVEWADSGTSGEDQPLYLAGTGFTHRFFLSCTINANLMYIPSNIVQLTEQSNVTTI